MWHDLARVAMCTVFAFTFGVSLARARARRSTVRGQLVALMCANAALFAGQLTLFGTPFTIRTAFTACVAVTDVAWLVSLFRHGPPAVSEL